MSSNEKPAGETVAIKPLEWSEASESGDWLGRGITGTYLIAYSVDDERGEWLSLIRPDGHEVGIYSTDAAAGAKAAAQADYERRIRSALLPAAVPAQVEKLREALGVFSRWAIDVSTLGELADLENRMAAIGVSLMDVGWWSAAAALSATPPAEPAGETPTHRHVKRGTEYMLIGYGKMQAKNWSIRGWQLRDYRDVNMQEVAIYRSLDDGQLWIRPRVEFEDGRFIDLRIPPAPESPTC